MRNVERINFPICVTMCCLCFRMERGENTTQTVRGPIRRLGGDGLTAKGCPPCLPLPRPLSGSLSGCLPVPVRRPLSLSLLLLHRDVELIVDAWVLLVEDDLQNKTGLRSGKKRRWRGPLKRKHSCSHKLFLN